MEFVIDDLRIYYEVYGLGFPIIMIHGFGPDHRILKGCIEPIFKNRKGYMRVYFDLPGMGRTKSVDWIQNADDMLEIILKFIQKVIPNQSFLIIGESYGAYLARGLIEKRIDDISGLCFISPVIIPDKSFRTLPQFHPIIKDSTFLSSLSAQDIKEFGEMHVVQTEKVWKRYKDDVKFGLELADGKFLTKFYEKGYSFTFDPRLYKQKFDKPSLFIMGRQDNVVGYHDAYQILENFTRTSFVILDKAAHDVQIEQEVTLRTLINEWIDRVEDSI